MIRYACRVCHACPTRDIPTVITSGVTLRLDEREEDLAGQLKKK